MGEGFHAPWSFQVELTEGCTRMCPFCGIHSIRRSPGVYRHLELGLARRMAAEIADLNEKPRVVFAMHGEPTMHPRRFDAIAEFRRALPRAQMHLTTNGARMRSASSMLDECNLLFDAGLNFILLDTYYPERDLLWRNAAECKARGLRVLDYHGELEPNGWGFNTHHNGRFDRSLVLMDALDTMQGKSRSRVIFNHAGSNPTAKPLLRPLAKGCTVPFREMSITYDGVITVCCMDWRRIYVCGRMGEGRTLKEIWWGPEFEAARAYLSQRSRSFPPCNSCDAVNSVRIGLIPTMRVERVHTATIERVVNGAKPYDGTE